MYEALQKHMPSGFHSMWEAKKMSLRLHNHEKDPYLLPPSDPILELPTGWCCVLSKLILSHSSLRLKPFCPIYPNWLIKGWTKYLQNLSKPKRPRMRAPRVAETTTKGVPLTMESCYPRISCPRTGHDKTLLDGLRLFKGFSETKGQGKALRKDGLVWKSIETYEELPKSSSPFVTAWPTHKIVQHSSRMDTSGGKPRIPGEICSSEESFNDVALMR